MLQRSKAYCESTNTTTTKSNMIHSRSQKIKGVTDISANTEEGKIQSRRKGESHHDTFRSCSRSHQAIEQAILANVGQCTTGMLFFVEHYTRDN